MDTEQIIAQLRAERERISQAIVALEALTSSGAAARTLDTSPTVVAPARGRRISAAGLKRISEAAKRRWAKIKAAKGAPRRHMSASARKRLSEFAKARWAKRKKQGKNRL
jgi:hypothetical protein